MILTNKLFSDFAIDATIISALKSNNILHPSKTQAEVLPHGLQGKDVLVRAKTGSGKTYAFCLPLVQRVIKNHEAEGPLALILAPTRELCAQIEQVLSVLLDFCENKIDVFCASGARNVKVEVPRLQEKPLILIGTPARICDHVQKGNLTLINVETLCIDEADLILSFGYEDDMKMITQNLPPKAYQCILTSATLSEDILKLKTLLMHDPVVVKIEEEEGEEQKLSEFHSMSEESDKFLLLFGLIKLRLVKGKVLIFVNSLNRGYKVKLFLEKFSVAVGVLNNELPYNTRMNVINQFNSGVLDYLIATDSSVEFEEKVEEAKIDAFLDESESDESDSEEQKEDLGKRKRAQSPETSRKRQKFAASDIGVHRGVDFREVAAVVNFDFPPSERNYTHRVGRTARGGLFGLAISFVNKSEQAHFQKVQSSKRENGMGPGHEIQPLHLTAGMMKPFNYRVGAVLGDRKSVV